LLSRLRWVLAHWIWNNSIARAAEETGLQLKWHLALDWFVYIDARAADETGLQLKWHLAFDWFVYVGYLPRSACDSLKQEWHLFCIYTIFDHNTDGVVRCLIGEAPRWMYYQYRRRGCLWIKFTADLVTIINKSIYDFM